MIKAGAFSNKKELIVSSQINLMELETKDIATAIEKLPGSTPNANRRFSIQ